MAATLKFAGHVFKVKLLVTGLQRRVHTFASYKKLAVYSFDCAVRCTAVEVVIYSLGTFVSSASVTVSAAHVGKLQLGHAESTLHLQ